MILLTIDPGVNGCGCALWGDARFLRAGYVENYATDGGKVDLLERARVMGYAVTKWANAPKLIDHVVIELPQTYGGRAAKGDANDLIAVATIVGALAANFDAAEVECILPREWKGNARKGVTKARALKGLPEEALHYVELPLAKGLQHNVWDAIGIGLWWLKGRGAWR